MSIKNNKTYFAPRNFPVLLLRQLEEVYEDMQGYNADPGRLDKVGLGVKVVVHGHLNQIS